MINWFLSVLLDNPLLHEFLSGEATFQTKSRISHRALSSCVVTHSTPRYAVRLKLWSSCWQRSRLTGLLSDGWLMARQTQSRTRGSASGLDPSSAFRVHRCHRSLRERRNMRSGNADNDIGSSVPLSSSLGVAVFGSAFEAFYSVNVRRLRT